MLSLSRATLDLVPAISEASNQPTWYSFLLASFVVSLSNSFWFPATYDVKEASGTVRTFQQGRTRGVDSLHSTSAPHLVQSGNKPALVDRLWAHYHSSSSPSASGPDSDAASSPQRGRSRSTSARSGSRSSYSSRHRHRGRTCRPPRSHARSQSSHRHHRSSHRQPSSSSGSESGTSSSRSSASTSSASSASSPRRHRGRRSHHHHAMAHPRHRHHWHQHSRPVTELPSSYSRRIRRGEFIDFNKLLFKHARYAGALSKSSRYKSNSQAVASLDTWLEAWSLYAGALASQLPSLAHDLFAYQGFISRNSQKFQPHAWLSYDTRFRQRLALNPSLAWSTPDPELVASYLSSEVTKRRVTCYPGAMPIS